MKDLKLQEVTFALNDSQNRIKELEQKQAFFKNQIDKLTSEKSQYQEELLVLKKENERDAKSDTQKADLRDKYNALLQENKILKKQLEAKYSTERFTVEQELSQVKSDNALLEAKNRQFESRVQQLEARLGGKLDDEVSSQAQKAHKGEIEEYERQSR